MSRVHDELHPGIVLETSGAFNLYPLIADG